MKTRFLMTVVVCSMFFAVNTSATAQKVIQRMHSSVQNYLHVTDSLYSLIQGDSIPGLWDKAMVKEFLRYDYRFRDRLTVGNPDSAGNLNYNQKIMGFATAPICNAGGDWKGLGPFSAPTQFLGRVEAIWVNPINQSEIVIGTNASGIWKTTDGGQNWASKTDDLRFPALGITTITAATDNQTLYAGTGFNVFNYYGFGLMKSTNAGESWTPIVTFPPTVAGSFNVTIRKIVLHPNNDNHVTVITPTQIFRSYDAGTTWEDITPHDVKPVNNAPVPWLIGDYEIVYYDAAWAPFTSGSFQGEALFIGTVEENADIGGAVVLRSFDEGETYDYLTAEEIIPATISTDITQELYSFSSSFNLPAASDGDYFQLNFGSPWNIISPCPIDYQWYYREQSPVDLAAAVVPDADPTNFCALRNSAFLNTIPNADYYLKFKAYIPANTMLRIYLTQPNPSTGTPNQFILFESTYSGVPELLDFTSGILTPGLQYQRMHIEFIGNSNYDRIEECWIDDIELFYYNYATYNNDVTRFDVERGDNGIFVAGFLNTQYNNKTIIVFSDEALDYPGLFGEASIGAHNFLPTWAVNPYNNNVHYLSKVNCSGYDFSSSITGTSSIASSTNHHDDVRAYCFAPGGSEGIIFIGNDGGVSRFTGTPTSLNNNANWQNLNGTGLAITQFFSVATPEFENYSSVVGTSQDGNHFEFHDGISTYLSSVGSDGGKTDVNNLADFIVSSGAGNMSVGSRNLSTPTMGGGSYFTFSSGLEYPVAIHPTNSAIALAGTTGGELYIKDAGGATINFSITTKRIKAVDIHSKFPQYRVAVAEAEFDAANTPGSCDNAIFYTTNNGESASDWTDITSNLNNYTDNNQNLQSLLPYVNMKDVVFDPEDPDIFYIGLGGVLADDGVARVYKTVNAGQSFVDMSAGLPGIPVNTLEFAKGSDEMLFAGTDVGIFYWDKAAQYWQCFNNNLPVAIVSDLSINYCEGKIYASTFGRGMWASDLPRTQHAMELADDITGSISAAFKAYQNIKIPAGHTLTVTDSLIMGANLQIIVEKGARLIVDGGTITNTCGYLWEGILVEGDATLPQQFGQGLGNQGIVIIKNNAVIEHARTAVSLIGLDAAGNLDWNKTGGIVQATGSTFKNNIRSAQFMQYTNTTPTGQVTDNRSFFTECTFYTDQLPQGVDPYTHVSLFGVRGVRFNGNTFRSNLTASKRGSGIVSIDASYKVLGRCTGAIGIGQPCPPANLVKNRFLNLEAGIVNYQGSASSDIYVRDAEFTGCSYGIKTEGGHYMEVVRSTFNVPRGSSQFPYNFTNFGIYSTTGDGLKAEENVFNASGTHGIADGRHIGIGVYHVGWTASQVYRNEFNGLETQVQDANMNRQSNFALPLQIDCNDFNLNTQTIASIHHAVGVLQEQGNCNPALPEAPHANIFTGNCDGMNNDIWQVFKNANAEPFEYNSYSQVSTGWELVQCTDPDISAISEYCVDATNPANACPSTLGLGIGDLIARYQGFRSRIDQNNNLIDGGDTQGVLNYLASTNNPGHIKNYLLARSPYLSDKVLIAAIQKGLPSGIIKQILLANASLSDAVWQAAQNASYPTGIVNELQAAQTGSSPRLELESENRYLNFEKLIALNDIVRIKLDSNEIDSAIYYLQTDGSIEATCLLVPVSIKRDTSITRQALATIHAEGFSPENISRDSSRAEDLQRVCAFGNFILSISQRQGGYYSLTPTEKQTLENFVNQETSVSAYARSILRWLGEEVMFDDAYPYDIDRKAFAEVLPEYNRVDAHTDLLVYPNPSNGLFTVQTVTTVPDAVCTIIVTDITGKQIRSVQVQTQRMLTHIDLSEFANGMYLCRLQVNGITVASSKMLKQ